MFNLNNQLIKYLFSFIAGCLVMFFITKPSYELNVKELKKENDALQFENQKLSNLGDSLKHNIDKSSLVIESLTKKDQTLKIQIVQLNNKIINVKKEYEKANNHSNNFSSLDIERYFAELQ